MRVLLVSFPEIRPTPLDQNEAAYHAMVSKRTMMKKEAILPSPASNILSSLPTGNSKASSNIPSFLPADDTNYVPYYTYNHGGLLLISISISI